MDSTMLSGSEEDMKSSAENCAPEKPQSKTEELLDTTFDSDNIHSEVIDSKHVPESVSESSALSIAIDGESDGSSVDNLSSFIASSVSVRSHLPSESEAYSSSNMLIESETESDGSDVMDESIIFRGIRLHDSLYNNSTVSILEAYVLVFQFAIKHSLTKTAISELLQLISVHLPADAKYPQSIHEVKGLFMEMFPHSMPSVHNYCEYCLSMLTSDGVCSTDGCSGLKRGQFISLPLAPQLKKIMENCTTWFALQERFQVARSSCIVSDVCDGMLYKKNSTFLSQPANISLIVNTDGVAIFQSSTVSLWPVWLVINELPRRMRFQKQHILLGGIWFSEAKPPMNSFLRPLLSEINELQKNGVLINSPIGQLTTRVILTQCSADLPARAQLTNMKNFNGKWGCLYCDSEGKTTPAHHLHRFWPYDATAVSRSPESFIEAGKEALTLGSDVKGIKGPTILSIHHPLQLPPAMVIDDLHCIYLGVTKHLIKLWFGTEYRHASFSIRSKLKICDGKLLQIKVPDVISRIPKSLSDVAHWKGSEYRNWLLFYSLPTLKDILPNPYFSHYSLLVVGLWILTSDSITTGDISVAERSLAKFYMQFHDLYGEKNTTMNVHLLSHLADCVKNWGPLWCYTCFVFETMNMHLKKFFHGTRNMTKQMAFSYVAMQSLITMPPECTNSSPKVLSLFSTLFGVKQASNKQELKPGTYLVGGSTPSTLPDNIIQLANEHLAFCNLPIVCTESIKVQTFYRVEVDGNTYYSALYGRVQKRNSYTVAYQGIGGETKFGLVQYYFIIPNQHITSPLVVIKTIEMLSQSCQSYFGSLEPAVNNIKKIFPVRESSSCDVTDVSRIISKCLYISFSGECNDKCIFQFPNQYLHD